MDFDEFLLVVERVKVNNPIWFELANDPIGTDNDIAQAEKQLLVSLPINKVEETDYSNLYEYLIDVGLKQG